jgi:hypothetical protein
MTSPHISAAVPMSTITGPLSEGNPKHSGLVPSAGFAPPGGRARGAALEMCMQTSPSFTTFSTK